MVNLMCFWKKLAFRKDWQRKKERAAAERQATQRAAANERANIRREKLLKMLKIRFLTSRTLF